MYVFLWVCVCVCTCECVCMSVYECVCVSGYEFVYMCVYVCGSHLSDASHHFALHHHSLVILSIKGCLLGSFDEVIRRSLHSVPSSLWTHTG